MIPVSRRLGLDWVMGKGEVRQEFTSGNPIGICKSTSAVNKVVDVDAPVVCEEERPVYRVVLSEGNEVLGEVTKDTISQYMGDGLVWVSTGAFTDDVIDFITKVEVQAVIT